MGKTKDKYKFLLLEGIHPVALEALEGRGHEVSMEEKSPSLAELKIWVKDFDVLGIRSKTRLDADFIKSNSHLVAIGTFCIGTDQVDTKVANELGIPVFNAPYSNTRSVAELVIAEIVALSRQLGDSNMKAHRGEWSKSAHGAHEIRGKTLGIIGYGHIGSQVSVLAEAFGMKVIYFDVITKLPLGNSQSCRSLQEVLQLADFVSLHVPDTPNTRGLIGERELNAMKAGAYLINASRGTVVDISALAKKIREGHMAGAAIDVFPIEPASNSDRFESELQGLRNVILTPHIGGSTQEAQRAIGEEVSTSLLNFIKSGATHGAVNFPWVDLPVLHENCHRILNVHRNVPGVLGRINGVVSEMGANIQAQSLATDPRIGYMIMDLEKGQVEEAANKIENLKDSIKTRVLF